MMKRFISLALAVVCVLSLTVTAFAYPAIGSDPKISLPKTYNSGAFTNYHFPNRYFAGKTDGFEVELNSATKSDTAIDIYSYKYKTSDGNTGTWYKSETGSTDTSKLGICSFSCSTSYYYCYKLTKTTTGTIEINYTVR